MSTSDSAQKIIFAITTGRSHGSAGSVSRGRTNRGTHRSRLPVCIAPTTCRTRFRGATGELDRRFAESPVGGIRNAKDLRASYAGKVSLIDDQVGQIVAEIERRGELDRIVF